MSNTIDNRYYFRLTPLRYQSLPAPAEFLAKRKLIKEPATEESEAVFYTAEDGLTIEQSINIHYEQTGSGKRTVQFYDESGDAPVIVASLDDCDRVLFSLWGVFGSELRAFIGAVDAIGEDPDAVIIPSGRPIQDYLSTGALPTA